MTDVLFATDVSHVATDAVTTTAQSLRSLGIGRRRWFLADGMTSDPAIGESDTTTRSAPSVGRRIIVGDDPTLEWVAFVKAGDRVTRDVLQAVRGVDPGVDVIYGDTRHDVRRPDRMPTYQRRPSYSPERLRSHDYIGGFIIARRTTVEAAGGLETLVCADAHDRNLRLCERARCVVRVPEILNISPSSNLLPNANPDAVQRHLSRVGIDADIEFDAETPRVRVRRRLAARPLVSIIVPTRGVYAELRGTTVPLVVNSVRTLFAQSSYPRLEIIIVADTLTPPEVRSELTQVGGERLMIVDYDEAFNFAAKNNIGVAHSHGEYVLLLNDDTEIITPDAIETMLALFSDSNVGIVGPMLYFEDGTIQSAGHVFSPVPKDMYRQKPFDTAGSHNYVRVQREVSSVIAACLLTSRKVYDEVGGLSTQFPSNWNDIDFALKVQQSGYKVVFTPYASFFHFESKTRVKLLIESEVAKLGHRWGHVLDDDPYFNPRLQRYNSMWESEFHSNPNYAEALGPTAPISSK